MDDYAIRMRFDIAADPDTMVEALTTTEGVGSWWSTKLEGSPGKPGARFLVSFPDVPQPHEYVVERDTPLEVAWRVGTRPQWWAGTTIRWQIAPNDDAPGTRLLFAHEGFEPDDEMIAIVTPVWAQVIQRLKSYAETGRPDPFFVL